MTSNRKSPAVTIDFDQLPIRVRGFVPPTPSNPPTRKRQKAALPSEWTLIFDLRDEGRRRAEPQVRGISAPKSG